MFATLHKNSTAAEVFHMTTFSHITHRRLPLYLANDAIADADDTKILRQYLINHVNEMWKKYL